MRFREGVATRREPRSRLVRSTSGPDGSDSRRKRLRFTRSEWSTTGVARSASLSSPDSYQAGRTVALRVSVRGGYPAHERQSASSPAGSVSSRRAGTPPGTGASGGRRRSRCRGCRRRRIRRPGGPRRRCTAAPRSSEPRAMYETLDRSDGRVLGYEIRDRVTEEELQAMIEEMETVIAEEGSVRLLVHVPSPLLRTAGAGRRPGVLVRAPPRPRAVRRRRRQPADGVGQRARRPVHRRGDPLLRGERDVSRAGGSRRSPLAWLRTRDVRAVGVRTPDAATRVGTP